MGHHKGDYRSVHETARGEIRASEGSKQGALGSLAPLPVPESHPVMGDRGDFARGASRPYSTELT